MLDSTSWHIDFDKKKLGTTWRTQTGDPILTYSIYDFIFETNKFLHTYNPLFK